jgi:hypothetical protein
MGYSTIGPQFGGKIVRTHVDMPPSRRLSIRRMSTTDLKVAQAILSEELRVVRVTVEDWISSGTSLGNIFYSIRRNMFGWNATDRQIHAMEARLVEVDGELSRRNLRDRKNGKTRWTRPRHNCGAFAVSLAEAARVH